MRFSTLVALCLAASLSFVVVADEAISITGTPESLRAAQDALKRDLTTGKGYNHLSRDEKRAIVHKQEAVYALIEGLSSFDHLNDDDERRLLNAVEEVRALVAQAEDSRMICERIKPTGSNRPANKCMTFGERRRIQEKIKVQQGIRVER
jgi:hypothetical protein